MFMNKTIKVMHLGSPTGLYGAEHWILALVKHLDPQRVTSIVGVIKDDPEQDGKLCQEADALGFQTKYFKARCRVDLSLIKQLRNYVLDEGIDILHTHFYKSDIIGFLATRGTPCKIISTPHGWTQNPDFKLRIYEIIDRMCFPFLDAVVPLSEDIYSRLAKVPGLRKKLHLIFNGVDIAEINSVQTVHAELLEKREKGIFVLGYIGRLIPGKGLDVLLQALASVQKVQWELFLVGEGPQDEDLKSLSRELGIFDKIRFTGFRLDRLEFLRGFDVFVLPSRSEGTPRCLMESMAAGRAIIASDIPGCKDLIQHEETGLLYEVDNVSMLSEQIEKMAASEVLRHKLSENALAFVGERYSATRMARDYDELYSNILNL